MASSRFRRRTTAVLLLGFAAAACGGNDTDTPEAGATPSGSSSAGTNPVKGGTFVVGSSPPLPAQGTLNPAVNTQGGMQQAAGMLFNGLVEIDDKAEPVPALAEKWDIADDGATWVFTLRDGVKFHNGSPLTAADVKWTYEAALLRNHARTQSSIGPALATPCAAAPEPPSCSSIEAAEASGSTPATVTFRFAKPYGPLLQQLTHTEGAILPKASGTASPRRRPPSRGPRDRTRSAPARSCSPRRTLRDRLRAEPGLLPLTRALPRPGRDPRHRTGRPGAGARSR